MDLVEPLATTLPSECDLWVADFGLPNAPQEAKLELQAGGYLLQGHFADLQEVYCSLQLLLPSLLKYLLAAQPPTLGLTTDILLQTGCI
jgi:hypothetical protein